MTRTENIMAAVFELQEALDAIIERRFRTGAAFDSEAVSSTLSTLSAMNVAMTKAHAVDLDATPEQIANIEARFLAGFRASLAEMDERLARKMAAESPLERTLWKTRARKVRR